MVMSHYGVGSYVTGVDSYANLPIRPSMTTASAEQSVLHRYHTGIEEEWKPKPKKSNVAISALVLLSFLFFLNILQNCVEDHMKEKHDHHHHGHRYPYYYQNYTYPQQYPWPIWQVSARTDLKPQQKPSRVEEVAYDEPQDDVSEDSVSEDDANEESTEEAPIERLLPDLMKTRVNSKLQPIPTGSVGDDGVLMERLAPIIDKDKKIIN